MQNYELKMPVRGLPRADGQRKPIGVGAVVALPVDRAAELLRMEAIEPSGAEVTCPLNWEGLSALGMVNPPISVVAVTDRYALTGAIEALGGIVFFVGEGLPDNATVVLADFSNDQLLAELDIRRAEGRLAQRPEAPEAEAKRPAGETQSDDGDDAATASEGQQAEPEAEAKPTRRKTAGK